MKARAPIPNLGSCSRTGEWKDPNIVSACKACLQTLPSYDNQKYFYCNQTCMNQYDLNQVCGYNDLVAKTESQCEKPCVQTGIPPTMGGCSDKFDCAVDEECMVIQNKGICKIPGTPFQSYKMSGVF